MKLVHPPHHPDAPGTLDPVALVEEGLRIYSAGGLPPGDSTGWAGVDKLYTVGQAQWTVVTGIPNSGKSEWLDALIVNLWKSGKWEFAIYSPENYPPSTHLIKFAEKERGKPFGSGPTARMEKWEFQNSATALLQDIFWIDPKLKSPEMLIETALSYRMDPDKKFGIVLDPWNTLEHQRKNMNETDYISFILTKVTELARLANAHIWLVVHPSKIYKDKNGVRAVPTPYDISGSAHWYNKADNIICVHREQSEQSQDVQIHVQKVRFKHIGHQGMAELKWDRVTGRYNEFPGTVVDRFGKEEAYL